MRNPQKPTLMMEAPAVAVRKQNAPEKAPPTLPPYDPPRILKSWHLTVRAIGGSPPPIM